MPEHQVAIQVFRVVNFTFESTDGAVAWHLGVRLVVGKQGVESEPTLATDVAHINGRVDLLLQDGVSEIFSCQDACALWTRLLREVRVLETEHVRLTDQQLAWVVDEHARHGSAFDCIVDI